MQSEITPNRIQLLDNEPTKNEVELLKAFLNIDYVGIDTWDINKKWNTKYLVIHHFFEINETNTMDDDAIDIFNKNLKKVKGMVPILQNSTEKDSQTNDNKRLQATNMTDEEKQKILVDQAEIKVSRLFEQSCGDFEEKKKEKEQEQEQAGKGKKRKCGGGDENKELPNKYSNTNNVYNIVSSALKATRRCREQHYHCDYSPKFGKKCYIGLLALQDDTTLEIAKYNGQSDIPERETIHIPKGSLFIARGDFLI